MVGKVEYNSILLLISIHDGVDDKIVVEGGIVVGCQKIPLMFWILIVFCSFELFVIMGITFFEVLMLPHKMIEDDILFFSIDLFFSY